MQSAFRMASGNKKAGEGTENASLVSESLNFNLSESDRSDAVGDGGKQAANLIDVSSSDDESDPGEGSSTAAATDLDVKSPASVKSLATSDNEDVIDSMVTAAEEVPGRLTMRVRTRDGMMLVKTPGTLRQASTYCH